MVRMRFVVFAMLPVMGSHAFAQLPPVPSEPQGDAVGEPRLYVARRLIDLGAVYEGDKANTHWHLENRGDADLIIERTRATCGCTVVKLTDEEKVIPPGRSLDLKVTFDSTGRHGVQSKTVTVYSNDPAEPALKLELTATVKHLYQMKPPGLVNLRAVRRGEAAARTIEILPGPGRKAVEILGIDAPQDVPVHFRHEPFDAGGGIGQRIHVTIDKHAALGTVAVKAIIKLNVDGIERERTVSVRAAVVGDLTWHPKVIDNTRLASPRGKRFAPVVIRSTDQTPFKVLSAEAGPLFDVTVEPEPGAQRRTQSTIRLTLRHSAASGPFGAMLTVRTSSLDQPVIRIPVFGIVAPPVEVEPPVVLLRQDGTPSGTHRLIKLQASPQSELAVSDVRCDSDAVVATIDRAASARYRHIRYLSVRLRGQLPEGKHHAVLTLNTNIEGAERLEVPVVIEVPAHRG